MRKIVQTVDHAAYRCQSTHSGSTEHVGHGCDRRGPRVDPPRDRVFVGKRLDHPLSFLFIFVLVVQVDELVHTALHPL